MSDGVLARIDGPEDLRRLDHATLTELAAEIRTVLIDTAVSTGQGHLGPNLGVVELTIALHRVFTSPSEPILFDVGHQAYVHKMLTGRAAQMPTLRATGGLSGYPSRAESPHDWIENSHASTALSYADGLSKAFEIKGRRRPVVAVVGDGALTGGPCWEALNNIAAAGRPVVVVVNDNGRSYSPTVGGFAEHLAGLRLNPGYERTLRQLKGALNRTPVVGPPLYDALHGVKRGIKDVLQPQGMFEDLGLKYVGPIDGHDLPALETALGMARNFDGPVVVHCVTSKGRGYAPAENDEADQLHQWRPVDPETGMVKPSSGRSWTGIFGEELVALAEQRGDIVGITAAMCDPVGMGEFARRFPERFFDVGIAEAHAMTSAAGLAYGGLHPVVSLYATFLNRAFDQLLMDVALHRLPVTVVLDRAGVTGADGPSHNGMWDLAMLGMVPGLRLAAPRDEQTLRELLREAVAVGDGPTVLRYPKTPLGAALGALRRVGDLDVLREPSADAEVDVLLLAVGPLAGECLEAAAIAEGAGYTVRVVAPRWVSPVDPEVAALARNARLVVSVEDGVVAGGVGARTAQTLREAGCDVPTREIGIPVRFLTHGTVADVRASVGLTAQGIGRRIVEWSALVATGAELSEHTVAAERDGGKRG